jgi:hypothetical protein
MHGPSYKISNLSLPSSMGWCYGNKSCSTGYCSCLDTLNLDRCKVIICKESQSQRSRGLRCGSAAARLLGMRVRIPPEACLSVVSVVCCRVDVSASDWSLVQRCPTECDREASIMRSLWPTKGYCTTKSLWPTKGYCTTKSLWPTKGYCTTKNWWFLRFRSVYSWV